MFKNSYDYLRNDESHMMKNTEWGAVTYLSHSLYGTCVEIDGSTTCSEIRVNNNSSLITGYSAVSEPTISGDTSNVDGNKFEETAPGVDGIYTINYYNSSSTLSSTTGNYTGIYDMSGGALDMVSGYTDTANNVGGNSDILNLYSDFFTNSIWDKYYDEYSSSTYFNYNNRILGDATGELGPFGRYVVDDSTSFLISSWYQDYAGFIKNDYPWFYRGNYYASGTSSGLNSFGYATGVGIYNAFRIVLAPSK